MIGGMERRTLLGSTAAASLATLGTCARPSSPDRAQIAAPSVTFDPSDWASVRAQFALDPSIVHMAAFVFATHPAFVREAIDRHRAGLDHDPVTYVHTHEMRLTEAVASAAASYLGTPAAQIAFTDSTTMGLGLLYAGLRLSAGDEVLTTEHDFFSTHEALRLRSLRGVRVRRVRLYDDPPAARTASIVDKLVNAVSPRTRVVAITWVHSSTGVRLPIAAIAAALRAKRPDVLLCVDGVHGFAAVDATPDQLGCDFLVTGTHKWLHGPRGTGLIHGTQRGWAACDPVIPSFGRQPFTPGGYHSFENRWALAEAFAFHAAIGRPRIAARITELATALKDGIAGIPNVRLITPRDPELSAGIVCCDVAGKHPGMVTSQLAALKVIASVTPYDPPYLRFGPTMLNTPADVEATLKALRTAAG
jgi:selenocysteine lyase/cysteine desulfurase